MLRKAATDFHAAIGTFRLLTYFDTLWYNLGEMEKYLCLCASVGGGHY